MNDMSGIYYLPSGDHDSQMYSRLDGDVHEHHRWLASQTMELQNVFLRDKPAYQIRYQFNYQQENIIRSNKINRFNQDQDIITTQAL